MADVPRAIGEYLSINQTAGALGVSRRTVERMIRDGELPAVKVRGQWRIRADAVRDYKTSSNPWASS